MNLSSEQEARNSLLITTNALMNEEWPVRVFKGEASVIFQTFIVLSWEPDANQPFGRRVNAKSLSEWPVKVFEQRPDKLKI